MSDILQQYREKYPAYNNVDDATLAAGIYKKKYMGKISEEDFYQRIGLQKETTNQPMLQAMPMAQEQPPQQQFPDTSGYTSEELKQLTSAKPSPYPSSGGFPQEQLKGALAQEQYNMPLTPEQQAIEQQRMQELRTRPQQPAQPAVAPLPPVPQYELDRRRREERRKELGSDFAYRQEKLAELNDLISAGKAPDGREFSPDEMKYLKDIQSKGLQRQNEILQPKTPQQERAFEALKLTQAKLQENPNDKELNKLYNENFNRYVQASEKQETLRGIQGAITTAAQAPTLGYADEIVGGIQSLLGRDYKESRDEVRKIADEFQKENPITSIGLQLLTGAPMALKNSIPVLLGEGAIAGTGLSDAEILEGDYTGIAEDAAKGALISMIFPAVFGVGKFTKRIIKGGRPIDALKKVGAIGTRSGRVANQLDYLKKQGSNTWITELDDSARDFVSEMSRIDKRFAKIVKDKFERRAANQSQRVAQSINKNLTGKDYIDNIDDISRVYGKIATPLYEESGKVLIPMDDELRNILSNTSAGKMAVAKASRLYSNKTRGGNLSEALKANTVKTEALDTIKKAMDDDIGKLLRTGANEQAKTVIEIKNNLLSKIDAVNPAYATARKVSGEKIRMIQAQEFGKKAIGSNQTKEAIQRQTIGYSPADFDAGKVGVAEKIREVAAIQGTRGINKIKRTGQAKPFFVKEGADGKMVPDNVSYRKFIKSLEEEAKAAESMNYIFKNSLTQPRAENIKELRGTLKLWSRVSEAVDYTVGRAVRGLMRNYHGMNKKNAVELARMMTDPEKMAIALRQLSKESDPKQLGLIQNALKNLMLYSDTETKVGAIKNLIPEGGQQ